MCPMRILLFYGSPPHCTVKLENITIKITVDIVVPTASKKIEVYYILPFL